MKNKIFVVRKRFQEPAVEQFFSSGIKEDLWSVCVDFTGVYSFVCW